MPSGRGSFPSSPARSRWPPRSDCPTGKEFAARLAMQNARAENMPKDNIERAIKKAVGGDADNYEAIRYEGYGPGGVAIIVEALTDNRNRTASNGPLDVHQIRRRSRRDRSVAFMFDRAGEIAYSGRAPPTRSWRPRSRPAPTMSSRTKKAMSSPAPSRISAKSPRTRSRARRGRNREGSVEAADRDAGRRGEGAALMKLVDTLEEDDDVQNVFTNFEVSDEVMRKLTAA